MSAKRLFSAICILGTAAFAVDDAPISCKVTSYWVFNADEEEINLWSTMVPMKDLGGKTIASVPKDVAERISMEGTGFLPTSPQFVEPDSLGGALLNLANDAGWPDSRFMKLNKSKYPWGLSGRTDALVPWWTVAVDPSRFPLGSKIYVPAFDGFELPEWMPNKEGKLVHDGFFYCGDISWSFEGDHIDVFTGDYGSYTMVEEFLAGQSEVLVYNKGNIDPVYTPKTNHLLDQKIEAEDYALVGNVDLTPGSSTQLYRNDDVDVFYSSDSDNGFMVGYIEKGEKLSYTFTTTKPVQINPQFRVATNKTGTAITLQLDNNSALAPFELPFTGGWDQWTTTSAPSIDIPTAGKHTLSITFNSSDFNFNWLMLNSTGTAIETPTKISKSLGTVTLQEQMLSVSASQPIAAIAVYDFHGRVVEQVSSKLDQEQAISLSNLARGTYIVRVQLQSGASFAKEILLR